MHNKGIKVEIRLPPYNSNSYKGQFGKVMCIGGSNKYYGAPIFTALGAQAGGADIVTLFMPAEHIDAAKGYSLNFFLNSFVTKELCLRDVKSICEAAELHDTIVIGNGIGDNDDVKKGVLSILSSIKKPIVIDAQALFKDILNITNVDRKEWILTPHHGEFKRLFELEPNTENLKNVVNQYGFTVCLKGYKDYIASPGNFYENATGVPQMRIGGTGDALAGIIGAYRALSLDSFNSVKTSTFLWGRCGEELISTRYTLDVHNMIKNFPKTVLNTIKKSIHNLKSEIEMTSSSQYTVQ